MSRLSRVGAWLECAVGVALAVCIGAAWVLPCPVPSASDAVGAGQHGRPCDLGAARCAAEQDGPAARRHATEQRVWVLGFSTAAVGAGIGLLVTARRSRR
jgi:hypothetical protein